MKRLTRYGFVQVLSIFLFGWMVIMTPGIDRGVAYAEQAEITLLSPAPDEVITGDTVTVMVAPRNFTFSCPLVGKPEAPGVGHWHLHMDGMPTDMPGARYTGLVDFECASQHVMSMTAVAPGWHKLQVILSTNGHQELGNPEAFKEVKVYYKPPVPAISILVPPQGAEIPRQSKIRVQLRVTNFTTSEDYFGKTLIPGIGHWHLFIDGFDTGLAMGNMVDMGGGTTDIIDTAGLAPGPHTLWARLVNNAHMPLSMDPNYPKAGDTYYPEGYPDVVSTPVTFIVK